MSNAQGHFTNTGCTVWAGLSLCKEFPVDQQLLLGGFSISYQGKLSRYLTREDHSNYRVKHTCKEKESTE